VLVVHEDADTRELALGALRAADHEAVAFVDPIVALDAIEADSRVRVLVTGATFPAGKPNGVSLVTVSLRPRHWRFSAASDLDYCVQSHGSRASILWIG
jgi:hypothetical protein